ncbi:nucleolar protein 11-like [Lepisosteus oculatus]|uniref:nucleolar protein 11-like n=1 Tax=Lepisosteus oculatus TaxID=7918 RepID=UPI003713D93C
MAALYEGYTLCRVVPGQNRGEPAVLGVAEGRETDQVVVTDPGRTVTVYKVSDQKPVGSWTVRQGQALTCPAVCNRQTGEYVVVSDHKVIRVWKDDDLNFDRVFKATVSAEVERVHPVPGSEPLVLFRRGAVRHLDALLAAPQQAVEDVLSEGEAIRWSTSAVDGTQCVLMFITEKGGDHLLYLQRSRPNVLHKYKIECAESGACPVSFTATLQGGNLHFVCLYSDGCVFRSLVSVPAAAAEGVSALPRTLLLRLPVSGGALVSAALLFLDDAHLAVVGAPHPGLGSSQGKDFLCVWNINFQTLQTAKEMTGGAYGQLWCYSGRLYVVHGASLSVLPYACECSSLAAALGKLKQSSPGDARRPAPILSWNALLHGEASEPHRPGKGLETRKSKQARKSHAAVAVTADQVLERVKNASEAGVEEEVQLFLSSASVLEQQLSAGQIAAQLVSRCQTEPSFYPQRTLVQLVQTQCLCHSVCPDLLLLALDKQDYFLSQLCLQHFPDIPEAITCACLKAFLSVLDTDLEPVSVDLGSVSFLDAPGLRSRRLQNGFSPAELEEGGCDVQTEPPGEATGPAVNSLDLPCPVGLKKAALLNEILQTAHSENFLLPHLKDLAAHQVLLFLRYLQFLYLKCSRDLDSQLPGVRAPTVSQIMDWVCLLLDSHFTVLVMVPEAKGLLNSLHKFVQSQVQFFSELGKIHSSLQEINKIKQSEETALYSIEVIKLF